MANRRFENLLLAEYRPTSKLQVESNEIDAAATPAIDSHVHIGRWLTGGWAVQDVDKFLADLDACNVSGVVNLDGRWGQELEENLSRYDRRSPGRFATFCHLDWSDLEKSAGDELLAASLRRSVGAGAKGLKIWKDVGLQVRVGGRLLQLDDPRLEGIWATAGDLGVPVAIHTADPVAFFDPVDARNERLEELILNPEWQFSGPKYPRFEDLINRLEAVVAGNPATTFIGLHVGCYSENLSWVDRMLSSYSNFYVDIGARIAELGRQPRRTAELVHAHPSRILFATDGVPPSRSTYEIYFRFLETSDEYFNYSSDERPINGRWRISGLGIEARVLQMIYALNIKRLIPEFGT